MGTKMKQLLEVQGIHKTDKSSNSHKSNKIWRRFERNGQTNNYLKDYKFFSNGLMNAVVKGN